MKCLLIIFMFLPLSAQTIEFYASDLGYSMNDLEEEIFEHVVQLYNKRNTEKLYINTHKIPFIEVFKVFKSDTNNFICVAQALTITEERLKKYAFSVPYIPIEQMIFALKSSPENTWKSTRVGYVNSSLEEKVFNKIKKTHHLKGVGFNDFDSKLQALLDGTIDFMIADNVAIFSEKKRK